MAQSTRIDTTRFLNRYHGLYFLKIDLHEQSIEYRLYSRKTNRCLLDILVWDNGQARRM